MLHEYLLHITIKTLNIAYLTLFIDHGGIRALVTELVCSAQMCGSYAAVEPTLHMQAEFFEALIGAVFEDGGYVAARRVYSELFPVHEVKTA